MTTIDTFSTPTRIRLRMTLEVAPLPTGDQELAAMVGGPTPDMLVKAIKRALRESDLPLDLPFPHTILSIGGRALELEDADAD